MNTTTIVTGLIFATLALIALIPSLFRSPKIKRKYQELDDRELIYQHAMAKRQWRNLLIVQYAMPALLVAMMIILKGDTHLATGLAAFAGFTFLIAFGGRKFFAGLELITRAEIEFRKLQKEKK